MRIITAHHTLHLSGVCEQIEILVWPLVVALAVCLYAPELDIQ